MDRTMSDLDLTAVPRTKSDLRMDFLPWVLGTEQTGEVPTRRCRLLARGTTVF